MGLGPRKWMVLNFLFKHEERAAQRKGNFNCARHNLDSHSSSWGPWPYGSPECLPVEEAGMAGGGKLRWTQTSLFPLLFRGLITLLLSVGGFSWFVLTGFSLCFVTVLIFLLSGQWTDIRSALNSGRVPQNSQIRRHKSCVLLFLGVPCWPAHLCPGFVWVLWGASDLSGGPGLPGAFACLSALTPPSLLYHTDSKADIVGIQVYWELRM